MWCAMHTAKRLWVKWIEQVPWPSVPQGSNTLWTDSLSTLPTFPALLT